MNQDYGWGLPVDASVHGAEIDRLIWIVHAFIAVIFIGWLAYLIAVLIRNRAGKNRVPGAQKPPRAAWLEALIPVVEIMLLFAISFPVFGRLRNDLPKPGTFVEIRVVAEQFAWNVHYPGPDRRFGKTGPSFLSAGNPLGLDPSDPAGKDDVTALNEMHVPAGKPVVVRLSSKDVIHSFGIPVMRIKQDVIPGEVSTVQFEAKKTGEFEIACAQLCGLGHYRMRAAFVSEPAEAFEAWLKSQAPPAAAPVQGAAS